jgi:hypothetical protein
VLITSLTHRLRRRHASTTAPSNSVTMCALLGRLDEITVAEQTVFPRCGSVDADPLDGPQASSKVSAFELTLGAPGRSASNLNVCSPSASPRSSMPGSIC